MYRRTSTWKMCHRLNRSKRSTGVGEMDAILLKKVEELTLYIIQQQKQIDALQKRLDENE